MQIPPPPKASLAVRFAGFVLFAGMLAFLGLCFLAIVLLPGTTPWWYEGLIVAAAVGLMVAVFWRKIRIFETWRGVVIGTALFAPVLVWLAWDDATLTHPLTFEELSPAVSQGEESYRATLAFTKINGQPAARELPEAKFYLRNNPEDKLEDWRAEIVKEREKLAAEWTALAPARVWLAELDHYPAIGDEPEPGPDTPLLNFGALRRITNATCAQAALLALDGKGDEALALLRPILSVGFKLERHGRSDYRLLMAHRTIDRALVTAQMVLATTTVSAAERAALATVIAERDLKSVIRRVAWSSYVILSGMILKDPQVVFAQVTNEAGIKNDLMVKVVSGLRPFLVLPRNTINLLARFAAAAERTMLGSAGQADNEDVLRAMASDSPKNFGGRLVVSIAVPNYEKLGESFRKSEATRLNLLTELRK